jgi:uncharacterized DUF497 family protein
MIKHVDYEFRWNDWNLGHIDEHGIACKEAEAVVCRARPPYPGEIGQDKYLVVGQTQDGTYIQVIYVFDPEETVFVLHARPLSDSEKRRFRRRRR